MTTPKAAAIAAAVALAIALPTLCNGFAIDDAYLIVNNPQLHKLSNIPTFFTDTWGSASGGTEYARINAAYYRPLTTTVQTFEYALFGLNPIGWHLFSALLHAVATALAALVIGKMAGNTRTALVGGLLFAVHPVHSEVIAAVTYQTTLLAAVLGIGVLFSSVKMFQDGVKPARLVWLALGMAAALVSKEDAVVIPGFVAAWVLIMRPEGFRRALLPILGVLFVTVVAVLAVRQTLVTSSGVSYFSGVPASGIVFTMLDVMRLYLELLLIPLRLCSFYDWFLIPIEESVTGAVWAGLAAVLALVLVSVASVRRAPLVAVGLAWIPIGLSPVLHIIPILNVAAERFLYLPSLGWALALAVLADRWLARCANGRKIIPTVVIGIILAAYSVRTVTRLPDWRDDRTLNQATARDFPETPTPLLNLAQLEAEAGNFTAAKLALEEAVRRAPDWDVPRARLQKLQELK